MAKSIADLLREMGIELDPETAKIIKLLEKKPTVPEDTIAAKLKLKINATRKLLYQLHTKGLVAYDKKRDPKKKWWYLYHWSLDRDRIKALVLDYKRKLLAQKQAQLEAEKRFAFECETCQEKYEYEDALESEFNCQKCGNILIEAKPTKIVLRLKREISFLENEISKTERQAK